jgi:MFS family permease
MTRAMSSSAIVRSARSTWGLPAVAGNGRLLAAAAIDSAGSGLFFAFQVIYFVQTTPLSLAQVGAALSVAQLLALPAPAAIGPLVDRFGPRVVAVVGNLVCAGGFVAFLVARDFWHVALAGLVVQVGVNFYWTSSGALIALAAGVEERARWFGLVQGLRNAGVAVGGALAALAVVTGGMGRLRWLVVANALSYVCAAGLTWAWHPGGRGASGAATDDPSRRHRPEPAPGGASYLTVLRDGAYLRLVAVNLVFVLAALVLNILLAVYIIEGLRGAAWWAGALLTVNCVLVAGLQTLTTRSVERHRATAVITIGALLNVVSFATFGLLGLAPAWTVVPGLLAAMVVYTLAEMLQSPTISTLSTSMAPDAVRGRYLAVYQSSWNIGGVLAPVLFTSLLARGPAWPWMLLVALNLASVLIVADLDRGYADRIPALGTTSGVGPGRRRKTQRAGRRTDHCVPRHGLTEQKGTPS